MKTRFISFLIILSSLPIFAEKKITVRNSDTGESFEVSVPDGLKIYEYNSNWLDSIPYLLERARYGEPWAYEALGDCYRYGKGGLKRSLINAITYYVMSGKDIEEMALNIINENPKDPLGLVHKLIDRIEARDECGILSTIDSLDQVKYHDADVIKIFMDETSKDNLIPLVEHNIMSPEVGTDEMLFTIVGSGNLKDRRFGSFENPEGLLKAISTKFPHLFNLIGLDILSDIPNDLDPSARENMLKKAVFFLEEADKAATLSSKGAEILYNHYKSEIEAGRKDSDVVEIERLATLAQLPESEIFIFTDKSNN